MSVSARLSNTHVSPQKARLLANQIRGLDVEDALAILDMSVRGFSKPLAKLVRSAVANAEDKNNRDKTGIDLDNLFVSTITVDQGPSNWRIRARAQGRAGWIQKKTSHVTIVLDER